MKEYEIPQDLYERLKRYLPRMKQRKGKRSGRPPHDWKDILDGIFWILKTGAPWSALPKCFPSKSAVHERFQLLVKHKFFERSVKALAQELEAEGIIDLEECSIDGTFAPAKRGEQMLVRQNEVKARK